MQFVSFNDQKVSDYYSTYSVQAREQIEDKIHELIEIHLRASGDWQVLDTLGFYGETKEANLENLTEICMNNQDWDNVGVLRLKDSTNHTILAYVTLPALTRWINVSFELPGAPANEHVTLIGFFHGINEWVEFKTSLAELSLMRRSYSLIVLHDLA